MNAAFSFSTSVFVDKVLESTIPLSPVCKPNFVVDLQCGVHVAQAGETDIMQRVVRNFMSSAVAPTVFKAPEGKRVYFLSLPDWQGSTLCTYFIVKISYLHLHFNST